MRKLVPLLLLCIILTGCAKQVTAPVPGSINTFDALSFRTLDDAQAAINSVKTTPNLTAGQKKVLNQAIQDYNVAEASWQAYHAGATTDTVGLTTAINQLVADVASIVTAIQGGK